MKSQIMELIVKNSFNGILTLDTKKNLIWSNNAADALLKKDLQQFVGKPLKEIIENEALLKEIETCNEMHKYYHIDKLKFFFNWFPLKKDLGKIVGTVIIFQELSYFDIIAEELSAYKALYDQLRSIIDSSYDGIYVTDGNAKTLWVNKAYERITGIKTEEVMGRSMDDLVKKGFFSQSITLQVLKTKKSCTLRQTLKTGKEILVTGCPVFNEEGEVILVVNNNRDITELVNLWEQVNEAKSMHNLSDHDMSLKNSTIIVKDPVMVQFMNKALKIALTDSSVLLLGETGVGKTMLAKYIHQMSNRSSGRFVPVSCSAIPETLFESELFGYRKGAFTGASGKGKKGLIELAEGGTLFLDEIGELPLTMQAKLLNVLQDHHIIPLGSSKPLKVNIRVITATNRNLEQMVVNGHFREDLYYRINIIPLNVPPLRQRPKDIKKLATTFLAEFNTCHKRNHFFSNDYLDYLCAQNWPGNVRQLRNEIEKAVLLSCTERIEPAMFLNKENKTVNSMDVNLPCSIMPLQTAVAQLEKSLIEQALMQCNSKKHTAIVLGIDPVTLWRKIKRYGIEETA